MKEMEMEKMTVYIEKEIADKIRHYGIDHDLNIGEVVTLAFKSLVKQWVLFLNLIMTEKQKLYDLWPWRV